MAHLLPQDENIKNLKAAILTAGCCLSIGLALFFITWKFQPAAPPVLDNGIEVNLGYGDEGLGDIAPLIPGDPAPELLAGTEQAPAPAMEEAASESSFLPAKQETDEVAVYKDVVKNKEKKDPAIKTTVNPTKTKKTVKPVEKLTTASGTKKAASSAAVVAKKKTSNSKTVSAGESSSKANPKAVYRGGTGTGGNNADTYNGVTNQGIAGGRGDQGRAGGNLTSDSYKGNGGTGKSGVSIREGLSGRRILAYPSFTDNFNQNARVAVQIVVDSDGRVSSASINPRGTTTTSASIRNIALKKAKQLRLSKSTAKAQTGTILFNFKLTG